MNPRCFYCGETYSPLLVHVCPKGTRVPEKDKLSEVNKQQEKKDSDK